jgi:dTMP kinase
VAAEDEGRFEALDLAFHERVRAAFLAQASAAPARSITVDAGRPIADVRAAVLAAVLAWLAGRPNGSGAS